MGDALLGNCGTNLRAHETIVDSTDHATPITCGMEETFFAQHRGCSTVRFDIENCYYKLLAVVKFSGGCLGIRPA